MAAAFALFSLIDVWHLGRYWPWTGVLTAFFLVFAWYRPAALAPLNLLWLKFGLLLHKVVNPIVMGCSSSCVVLPTGLVMRALGKDPLRLKGGPNVEATGSNAARPGRQPRR